MVFISSRDLKGQVVSDNQRTVSLSSKRGDNVVDMIPDYEDE